MKAIRPAKSYFSLVHNGEKTTHCSNTSVDNRKKLITNLEEAVAKGLCRQVVRALI